MEKKINIFVRRNSLLCRNEDYIIIRSDPKELIFLDIGKRAVSPQVSLIMFPLYFSSRTFRKELGKSWQVSSGRTCDIMMGAVKGCLFRSINFFSCHF